MWRPATFPAAPCRVRAATWAWPDIATHSSANCATFAKATSSAFETLHGEYQYRVRSTRIVTPQDVSVLRAGYSPEITLVTCYPFYYVGSAPDRFIVKARQVGAVNKPRIPQPAVEQVSEAVPPPQPEVRRAKPDGPRGSPSR